MSDTRARWFLAIGLVSLVTACGGATREKGAARTTTAPASTTTGSASTTTVAPADAGSWSLIPDGPNALGRPGAWTGRELLVAQSACCGELGSVNLAAYNPATSTWRKLPPTPLTPRIGAAGIWTGTEMIVAGGLANAAGTADHADPVTDGAAWDAATNTWHPIAAMPTTLAGLDPTSVWTGQEMLVWSSDPASATRTGAREVVLAYNPSTDTWRSLPLTGLTPRAYAVTVWTGKELVTWGGLNSDFTTAYGDGARLDPVTGTWRVLPPAPVPARGRATAVWSGREVLIWGGDTAPGTEIGRGAAYDPATDQWRALPGSPLRAKNMSTGVWTGHFFLVIGGATAVLPVPGPGAAAYNPATNTWTALPVAPLYPPATNGPTYGADQRADSIAVWTGNSAVVVGGLDFQRQGARADGLQWTPAS